MELRQFTYVKMAADCGSFTKAAEKLFISQPALSNYIGKVEESLGVKLFDRSSTPLKLTYAGEQYLKRSRVILSQMEDMDREFRDITHHMRSRLKLGFPSERIIYMLPLILAPFKQRYPGIDVKVISGSGNSLRENLRAGEVDFVLLPTWSKYKDISQVTISREELVVVAAKGYLQEEHVKDRERKIVDWRQLSKLPIITLYKGHALRSSVDVLYRNVGRKPDIFLESHSNMLSYRLAAQGLGFAIVPDITLDLMEGSMEAEVYHLSEYPVTWDVQALYREGTYIGEVEQSFLEIAKEAMRANRTP
ncbi:MAG: LysR family transcriptional regulator [Clostridiales bacterium]|nr:LysR family transcriptional regulator [Clostridiales bacterium]